MKLRATHLVLGLSLAACGDKAEPDSGSGDSATPDGGGSGGEDTDGGTGGEGSGGGESGGSGGSSSDQPPTMTGADAYCYQHETGEARWIWQVTGQADDPQGLDTLELIVSEGVVVKLDGAERARLDLACNAGGGCSASFDETQANALCTDAARTTFELTALDEDGNRSEPAVATGRQQ